MIHPLKFRQDYDKLAMVSEMLNHNTDQLTEVVLKIETQINHLNLGIRVQVETRDPNLIVGYGKITSGKWGLILTYRDREYDYASAPRNARLVAIEALPFLLEELLRVSTETINQLKNANTLLDQIQKTMK